MRLDNYIINEDIDKYIPILERDCSRIIKIYKNTHKFLYRGLMYRSDFLVKKWREESRRPKSTPKFVHDYLNKRFKDKFGWNVRNGISATSKLMQASFYGVVYIFFPVNDFEYVYAPNIGDLYAHLPGSIGGFDKENNYFEKYKDIYDRLFNRYINSNLEGALINQQGEIMFKTSKYYLIHEGRYGDKLDERWLY